MHDRQVKNTTRKIPNRALAAIGAAGFVISAGLAFIWLIESYHREAVYTDLLRLAAAARLNLPDIDRLLENMHASDVIAAPLRGAAAVIFLTAIAAARAAWVVISQAEQLDAQRQVRWDMQRQLQNRNLRLREERARVDQLVEIDGLTQVSRRKVIEESIDREWGRAARVKGPLSVVLLDVDGMTEYNDMFGHIAGDAYLKALGSELRNVCGRPSDVVGRFEGDVFCLVLGATDVAGARQLAEACRRAAHAALKSLDDPPSNGLLTVSVSVVTAFPRVDSQPDRLLVVAKSGIDNAKKAGGDTVVVGQLEA